MMKFKVLKEEMTQEYGTFKIPTQIILEGDEKDFSLTYSMNDLRESLDKERWLEMEDEDKILVSFAKEETDNLPNIMKSIITNLELLIKKHITEKKEREQQHKASEEKRKQDLEEVKGKLEELDFD